MNTKHLISALLSGFSIAILTTAGCAADPNQEWDDMDGENMGFEIEEDTDTAESALITSSVSCNGGGISGSFNVYSGVSASTNTTSDGAYDIRSYCLQEVNKRRRQTHPSYDNLTLNAYYGTANDSVVPAYTEANVANDGLNTTIEYCRAIADAKAGNHAGYGNPITKMSGHTAAAFCPVGGSDVQTAVKGCLNSIEKESGYGGHQGGMLWDQARSLSCAMGVVTVNGVKKKGISIQWGIPALVGGANLPNGARCKYNAYCASGACMSGICKGAAGTSCRGTLKSGTNGVTRACVDHAEDAGLCLPKGFDCQSGTCNSNGTCQ